MVLTAAIWSSAAALAQEHGDHGAGHSMQEKDEKADAGNPYDKAVCPVSGESINIAKYTYQRGKRVYFCCNDCKSKFAKDPDKYADGVKAQRELLKPLAIQVSCPGTGKPIDKKVFVEEKHGRVYFCGEGCKAGWERDSTAMKKKLAESVTYQTNCPIMGGQINPAVYSEVDGRTVYFCCPGCEKKFVADKDANFKKVDEQIKKNKAAMEKRHGKKDHG
jgi:YHS domain-containing protein